jgi:hypothetical protein
MKNAILACLLFTGTFSLNAQVMAPAPSPFCKIEQKVGLTDVTLEYSRPSAKGRTVFGDLVPYGKPWRAGANAVTKVSFSTDVNVGGSDLKAGSYALLITPQRDSWQLHFFNYDKGSWSSYIAEGAPVAAAVVTIKTIGIPMHVESWTIGVGGLKSDGAGIDFLWEKTFAQLPITVPTDKAVMASIEKTMAGPDAGDYYSAASYYLNEGKDMEQALTWVNASLDNGGDRFWILRTKALIQAKLGDHAGAIASAKKSTELAEAAGNDEYPTMNAKSIKEWMK